MLCYDVFLYQLNDIVNSQLAYKVDFPKMEAAFKLSQQSAHKDILVLDEKISDCNIYLTELDTERNIKLIVLPRDRDNWQIWTVNLHGKRFAHYVDVLEENSARELIGGDLVFVHKNQFIGITKSKSSALTLAVASIAHARATQQVTQTLTLTQTLTQYITKFCPYVVTAAVGGMLVGFLLKK